MHDSDRVIDEYTLAAFLAGTLPDERRKEVVEYLAANPDAREVLQMAAAALHAARSGDIEDGTVPGLRPASRRDSRAPVQKVRRAWTHGAARYIAATVIVFVIGLVLRLTLGPPTDALRSPLDRGTSELRIEVTTPGPFITWQAVENAYRYRLVVWDPAQARVVGQYETTDSSLGPEHGVVRSFTQDLVRGQTYTLRIDAIDPQNRLVRSSDSIEFQYE